MFTIFDFILISLGIFAALKFYRQKTKFAKSILNIQKPVADILADELQEYKNVNKVYLIVTSLFIIVWLIAIFNFRFNLVEGWIVLAIAGLVLATSNYFISDLSRNSLQKESNKNNKDSKLQLELKDKDHQIYKSFVITILMTAIFSGMWAYQIQRNLRQVQGAAISEILSEYTFHRSCGGTYPNDNWPCIYIGGIDNITFARKNRTSEMCIRVWFDNQRGLPYLESFSRQANSQIFCSEKNSYGGWDKYNFETVIKMYMDSQVKMLTVNLCKYAKEMDGTTYSTYCS